MRPKHLKKWKKTTAALLLTGAITLPALTGGIGWRSGKLAQQSKDEATISQIQNGSQLLKDELAHHRSEESTVIEFLQDLRGQLAANAELETLFKGKDLHSLTDRGVLGSSNELASLECCKAETKTLSDLFRKG